ncbi:MAG: hemerythrin domain-containing protein [Deltaproteobacteria bacterium]|nr:hemerythrin domain-containing protein [Deltaproteobacteria bacterium]
MGTIVDLIGKTDEQAVTELTAAFKNLGGKDQLHVKGSGDYRAVISGFQNSHWGQFDWLPIRVETGAWSGYLAAKSSSFASIVQIMESQHKHCDTMYVEAENTLNGGNETEGKVLMEAFIWNMEVHFGREEQILFPAFEDKTGMTGGGPTHVMRAEHEQIRGVLKEMKESLKEGDYQRIFDQAETMLILIQQHNSKEEQILYPMLDQHLGEDLEQIAKEVQLFVL